MDDQTARAVAAQLARPTGEAGRKVAEAMAGTNAFITARTLEALGVAAGETLLEIGPGSGALSRQMARDLGPRGTYLGVELSEDMAKLAETTLQEATEAEVRIHCCDCSEAPIAAGTVDGVMAVNVLYFVEELGPLFERILGWLKPGGRVAFGVRSAEVMKAMPVARHGFRIRTTDELLRTASKAGFVGLEIRYFDEGTTRLGDHELEVDTIVLTGRRGAPDG